jgi:hypothetical protein
MATGARAGYFPRASLSFLVQFLALSDEMRRVDAEGIVAQMGNVLAIIRLERT